MKSTFRIAITRMARLATVTTGLMIWTYSWAYINHEVKRGETLWGIAHHYGVSADEIVKLNPTVKNGLKNGITIRIPEHDDHDNIMATDGSEQVLEIEKKDTDQAEPVSENHASVRHHPAITNPLEFPEATRQTADGAASYVARFGDTFKSVEAKTGVSAAVLAELNPLIDGDRIPESEVIRLTAEAPHSTFRTELTTVDSIIYNVTPTDWKSTTRKKDIGVAIMLPFELSQDEISRQALLATEFYKGFLLATKENSRNIDYELRIYAVDTSDDSTPLQKTIQHLADEGVTVVIPPDDDKQIEEIEDLCEERGMTVFNVLNIKDDGYLSHPNVVQCNINQKMMYDKAIDALEMYYGDYTPVILDLAGGKDEKSGFTQELQRQFGRRGIKVAELTFTDMLQESDLIKGLSEDKKYILIPKSGSQDVFEKISEAIALTKESEVNPERIKLFGYPDWVAFRGQAEDELHRIGAVIYSRFNFNPADPGNGDINSKFRQWYGSSQIEVFPTQGTLGYDAGNALYRMMSTGWPETIPTKGYGTYSGEQSSFRFMHNDDKGGIINDALYIIEFLPGNETYSKVI